MVQVAVAPGADAPQIAGREPFTLEEILQYQKLLPVKLNPGQRFLMLFGRLPPQQLSAVSGQYGAGRLADLPVQPEKGYSAVTLRLQTPSEVRLDNLVFETDYVFAAATHAMWVELGTPATVVYEGPAQLNRGGAYFNRPLIIPTRGEVVALTVTGIRPVPELAVLETSTKEHILSPDLVKLGDGNAFYDIAAVRIRTAGAVRMFLPQNSLTPLSIPVKQLLSHSLYAAQGR